LPAAGICGELAIGSSDAALIAGETPAFTADGVFARLALIHLLNFVLIAAFMIMTLSMLQRERPILHCPFHLNGCGKSSRHEL